ncbi:MAG: acyl carrier protein [Candidatus Omnitrophica bacterium]|nr:acyl carrier protein [Candidatus Omnitrophota bacterium]
MISQRLKRVVLEELGLDGFEMTSSTMASQVPGWDSLAHLRVLAAVEKEYNIRFTSLEVIPLKNVGDLQLLVDKKIRNRSPVS